jgi:hypothetical protein
MIPVLDLKAQGKMQRAGAGIQANRVGCAAIRANSFSNL